MRPTEVVFAENVRRYRLEAGMSELELSRHLGQTRLSYVRDIEAGKQGIQLRRLDVFAEALGVLPLDLIEDWEENDHE